jgi:conjugal transfer pilus assembly protein TraW
VQLDSVTKLRCNVLPAPSRARGAELKAAAVLMTAALTFAGSADAISLGTIGPTYPIAEENLLDLIAARLKEKERTGELERLQSKARERATQTVTNPTPVAGLRTAQVARTFYFDPTFTLDHNISDPGGNVMYAAGTRKNPLEIVSMSKHLLFFDARDPRQVARAREVMAIYQGHVKPILVGGSFIDLMKAWHVPVYYDQAGVLTRRLGITAVPAIVSQEGQRLRIDELTTP